MTRHLLVTNDFPPKVGGIQNYLWDLWQRLDPASFVVVTANSDEGAAAFDEEQAARGIRIERVPESILFFPTPGARNAVLRAVEEHDIDFVLFDPVLPLGVLGPRLGVPYGVILHGAEVAVPGRLLGTRAALARVLRGARLVVSAGSYPAQEARRAVPDLAASVVEIPPGVDVSAIAPFKAAERRAARSRLGLPERGPLVVSVSRLVPRKGMDVLIEAAAAGVPQIAGDSGGAAEAVLDGETGLVVAMPGDPGAVAEALRTLLADPTRRRRMGRAARSRVRESFDNDVLASRLADALAGVAI